jgi:hypothetical protein
LPDYAGRLFDHFEDDPAALRLSIWYRLERPQGVGLRSITEGARSRIQSGGCYSTWRVTLRPDMDGGLSSGMVRRAAFGPPSSFLRWCCGAGVRLDDGLSEMRGLGTS